MKEYAIDKSFEPLTIKEANRLRRKGVPKMREENKFCLRCNKLLSGWNKKDICNPCNDSLRIKWELE